MKTAKAPNDFAWNTVERLMGSLEPAERERKMLKWLEAGWNPFAPQAGGAPAIDPISCSRWALPALRQWAGLERGFEMAKAGRAPPAGAGTRPGRDLPTFAYMAMHSHRRRGALPAEMVEPLAWLMSCVDSAGLGGAEGDPPPGLALLGWRSGDSLDMARLMIQTRAPASWFGAGDPATGSRFVQALASKRDAEEAFQVFADAGGHGAALEALGQRALVLGERAPESGWGAIHRHARRGMARAALAIGHRPDWEADAAKGYGLGGAMAKIHCESAPWELAEKASKQGDAVEQGRQLRDLWHRPDCGGELDMPEALASRIKALIHGSMGMAAEQAASIREEGLALCQARHLRSLVAEPASAARPAPRL